MKGDWGPHLIGDSGQSLEAGLECLSGICHLIVKHFSRTDVVNGLCEEDRKMKLFKLSPFYRYYEMYVPSDPIDDDRCKQVQLVYKLWLVTSLWLLVFLCFRVGMENRQRIILIKERLQNLEFLFLCCFCPAYQFLCFCFEACSDTWKTPCRF